jgi:hypothetical protein
LAKALEAGKLIVGTIAVCTDPTGTAAIALGCDAALQTKAWFTKTPDLAALAKELDKKFAARLAEPQFDKPKDARALLPQMLEHASTSSVEIAQYGLDPNLVLANMNARLDTAPAEYRTPAILSAFEALTRPLITEACNDTRLEQALRPHLTRASMRNQRKVLEGQAEDRETRDAQYSDLKGLMEQVLEGQTKALSLEDMKKLAARFGNHDITDKAGLNSSPKRPRNTGPTAPPSTRWTTASRPSPTSRARRRTPPRSSTSTRWRRSSPAWMRSKPRSPPRPRWPARKTPSSATTPTPPSASSPPPPTALAASTRWNRRGSAKAPYETSSTNTACATPAPRWTSPPG